MSRTVVLVALALLATGCGESRERPASRDDLIAFARTPYGEKGTFGVYVVRPDGTGERRLTPRRAFVLQGPRWSPDGTRLAYVDMGSGLYTVTLDGKSRTLINRQVLQQESVVAWAPDGRSLAVTVHFGPHLAPTTAAIVAADGGPLEHLVVRDVPRRSYESIVNRPVIWSPDGRRVAYSHGPSHPWGGPPSPWWIAIAGIYTLRPDGGDRRRVTHSGRAQDEAGHWLRNGRILFTRREGERLTLYSVEEDGDRLTRIARLPEQGSGAFAVSNDERSIAWETAAGVEVVSLDGGPARLLADSKGARELAWSPGDGSIAFTRDGSIWVLDLSETRARRITPARSGDEEPAWRPNGGTAGYDPPPADERGDDGH
jgi:Tol biopolymer transport system component